MKSILPYGLVMLFLWQLNVGILRAEDTNPCKIEDGCVSMLKEGGIFPQKPSESGELGPSSTILSKFSYKVMLLKTNTLAIFKAPNQDDPVEGKAQSMPDFADILDSMPLVTLEKPCNENHDVCMAHEFKAQYTDPMGIDFKLPDDIVNFLAPVATGQAQLSYCMILMENLETSFDEMQFVCSKVLGRVQTLRQNISDNVDQTNREENPMQIKYLHRTSSESTWVDGTLVIEKESFSVATITADGQPEQLMSHTYTDMTGDGVPMGSQQELDALPAGIAPITYQSCFKVPVVASSSTSGTEEYFCVVDNLDASMVTNRLLRVRNILLAINVRWQKIVKTTASKSVASLSTVDENSAVLSSVKDEIRIQATKFDSECQLRNPENPSQCSKEKDELVEKLKKEQCQDNAACVEAISKSIADGSLTLTAGDGEIANATDNPYKNQTATTLVTDSDGEVVGLEKSTASSSSSASAAAASSSSSSASASSSSSAAASSSGTVVSASEILDSLAILQGAASGLEFSEITNLDGMCEKRSASTSAIDIMRIISLIPLGSDKDPTLEYFGSMRDTMNNQEAGLSEK